MCLSESTTLPECISSRRDPIPPRDFVIERRRDDGVPITYERTLNALSPLSREFGIKCLGIMAILRDDTFPAASLRSCGLGIIDASGRRSPIERTYPSRAPRHSSFRINLFGTMAI